MQTHIAASCAILAAVAAVLPFFPAALVSLPAALEVGLRLGLGTPAAPLLGLCAGSALLGVHAGVLSFFRDAQLADARGHGSVASHPEVLGMAIIAGEAEAALEEGREA